MAALGRCSTSPHFPVSHDLSEHNHLKLAILLSGWKTGSSTASSLCTDHSQLRKTRLDAFPSRRHLVMLALILLLLIVVFIIAAFRSLLGCEAAADNDTPLNEHDKMPLEDGRNVL